MPGHNKNLYTYESLIQEPLVPLETEEEKAERERQEEQAKKIAFRNTLNSLPNGLGLFAAPAANFLSKAASTGAGLFQGVTTNLAKSIIDTFYSITGQEKSLEEKEALANKLIGFAIPGLGIAQKVTGKTIDDAVDTIQEFSEFTSPDFGIDEKTGLEKDYVDLFREGRYAEGAEQFGEELSGAVPSFVSSIVFGLPGLAAQGVSALGNKYAEIMETKPDATLAQKWAASTITGGGEFATELFTYRLGRAYAAAGKGLSKAPKNQSPFNITFNVAKDIAGEAASEATAEAIESLIADYAILDDEEALNNLPRRLFKTAVIGGVMGGVGSSLTSFRRGKNKIENPTDEEAKSQNFRDLAENILQPQQISDKQRALYKEIIELQSDIELVDNIETKAALNKQIKQKQESLRKSRETVSNQFDELSDKDLQDLAQTTSEIDQLDSSIKRKETPDLAKQELQKQKDELENQRVMIFTLMMNPNQGKVPKNDVNALLEKYDGDTDKMIIEGLSKTPQGKETFDFVQTEFGQAIGGLTESITKRIYDRIPEDKKKTITRDSFKSDLVTDASVLVTQEFDATKQDLGTFLTNRLNLRANRIAKDLGVSQQDQVDITETAAIEQEQTAIEEVIDNQDTIDQSAIDIGNQIKLPEALTSEISNAARLALMTTKERGDALKFATDISKTLKDKLYKQVTKFFGRDTKDDATFTNTLENNAEALYDLLRPEAMVMARDVNTNKNPFEEAGFLKNKEKVQFKSVGKEAFVNYFKGVNIPKKPDGTENRSAKANRKIRLAETLAVSLGANEAINLLKTDATLRQSFVEAQKALDPISPKSIIEEANDIQSQNKSFSEVSEKSAVALLKKFGLPKIPGKGNESELISQLTNIVKLFPKEAIEAIADSGPNIVERNSLSKDFIGNNRATAVATNEGKKIINSLQDFGNNFDEVLNYEYLKQPKQLFKNEKQIENLIKTGELNKINEANSKIHRQISKRLYEYVKADKNRLGEVLAFMKPVGNESNNWWKLGAQLVAYEKGMGNNIEFEHAMVASAAYRALFAGAASNVDFNTMYPLIMNNYKMVAMSKKSSNQLIQEGLQRSMREGWTLNDNYLDRYKNLDLNNFINIKTNQSLLKDYNLFVEGKQTPDIKSTQQKGLKEKTGDNVELFIDRVIAKLQNLTGSPGTLQTNIAAIPTSLLIGGLRTVKLAYKGGKALAEAVSEGYKYVKSFVSEQEWSDFVEQSTYEVADRKVPAEKQLAILSEKGVREAQEKVRKENENNLAKLGEKTKDQSTDKIISDLKTKKDNKVKEQKEKTSTIGTDALNIFKSKGPTKSSLIGKLNIYVPPGADDFAGLLYTFYKSGKAGEKQMKFFEENIMTPFAKGINAYEAAKVALGKDYKELKKRYKNKALLKQSILDGQYTNEDAVRTYLFSRGDQDLGISESDQEALIATVVNNNDLLAFAEDLSKITKTEKGYTEIYNDWEGGNIDLDLNIANQTQQRKEFLAEFLNNKEQIFSKENMKVIKQLHGEDFTDALSNVLTRMETGVNRKQGKDKEFNSAMNWINQSVANVMAVNVRSAVLQQLSIVNFMNFTHNNPLAMARAMSNRKQFTEDFFKLWNSSFLTDRRGGQKIELNTADIADSQPGNWFLRANKKLLELGFKPTQWGDSFAISFGGASWYRNRIDQLVNQGVDPAQAEEQTMLEFQEVAEETQQSSRPDRISRQQSSDIGRLILAFANTPLQYARLTKKATLDLINRRGDWRTNASKILYYGAAQNIIFSGLQSALFSLLLSDNEDDEKDEKKIGFFANTIADGFLRGMGYSGAVVAALKNLGQEYYSQQKRREAGERVADPALRLIQKGLSISPPVSKKIGDIIEAQRFENWRQYKEDPFYQYFAKANYVSGLTNIPLDRAFKKVENLKAISAEHNDAWQNIFLALGWSPYQLDVEKNIKESKVNFKKFKPKKFSPAKKIETKQLGKGVMGRANNDGTIEVDKDLSPVEKKRTIAHEKQHMRDMKSGKLNYDDNYVYWKGSKYPRVGGKIQYNNKKYIEGHSKLPWEEAANKAERQVN